MPDMIVKMIHKSQNYRISAWQIQEISKDLGLANRINAFIAERKGAGIISPRLSLVTEMLQSQAPIYELNPSVYINAYY